MHEGREREKETPPQSHLYEPKYINVIVSVAPVIHLKESLLIVSEITFFKVLLFANSECSSFSGRSCRHLLLEINSGMLALFLAHLNYS